MEWLGDQISGRTSPAGTAQLLHQIGVSATGLKSVEENEITGDMLVQFCDDDIKDAFTVFKDRFLIRKLLRSVFTRHNTGDHSGIRHTPTPSDVLRVSGDNPDGIDTVLDHIPETHNETVSRSVTSYSPRSENELHVSTPTSYPERRSPFPYSQPIPASLLKDQFSRNQDGSPLPKRIALAASLLTDASSEITGSRNSNSRSYSPGSSLVHHRPSSSSTDFSSTDLRYKISDPCYSTTNYQSIIKRELISPESDARNRLPTSSKYGDMTSCSSRDNDETRASVDSGTDSAVDTKDWYLEETSDVVDLEIDEDPPDNNRDTNYPPNAGISYLPKTQDFIPGICYRNPARNFSAEELMSKKEVRTKANAAQRAGQMLIRYAAQAAGLWDKVPFLKDITPQARDVFFRHVFANAPQLGEHTEMVWQKLKEALLNRRKYLLDKELGKRMTKRERELADSV